MMNPRSPSTCAHDMIGTSARRVRRLLSRVQRCTAIPGLRRHRDESELKRAVRGAVRYTDVWMVAVDGPSSARSTDGQPAWIIPIAFTSDVAGGMIGVGSCSFHVDGATWRARLAVSSAGRGDKARGAPLLVSGTHGSHFRPDTVPCLAPLTGVQASTPPWTRRRPSAWARATSRAP